MTIEAKATTAGLAVNNAEVTAEEIDSNLGNNTASASVRVGQELKAYLPSILGD